MLSFAIINVYYLSISYTILFDLWCIGQLVNMYIVYCKGKEVHLSGTMELYKRKVHIIPVVLTPLPYLSNNILKQYRIYNK